MREYLYLQLNANFIQAFEQNHIHSLSHMILLSEKKYQHLGISHPAYKVLWFCVSAKVYSSIIEGLNASKRCWVTMNVLVNLIMHIKKKELNSTAASESYAWKCGSNVVRVWSCPGRHWDGHLGEAWRRDEQCRHWWTQVNTRPPDFQNASFS